MKIVVDSNIVFSAILNTQSKIGQLLINGSKYFEFFTTELLKEEITRHREKILHLTGLSEDGFEEVSKLFEYRIQFVNEVLLSDDDIDKAFDLVSDIDENDTMFVALNNHLQSILWTGDKKLLNGLKKKGYSKINNHRLLVSGIFE